jgi:uncharacterized protein (TIGR03435 family)
VNSTLAGFDGVFEGPGRAPRDRHARDGDTESPLPSLFTALQEQYGLRLEKAKVPLEILVIDRVEKVPSEN